jgi:uncharacterized protein YraI
MATKSSNVGLWIGISLIVVMVFAGIAMLIYAVVGILEPGTPVAAVSATPFVPVILPTQTLPTQAPPPQAQPTQAPPAAPTTQSGPILTITTDANIRTGPGTNYPVLGGLPAGSTATVVGRDSGAQWYVITYYNSQGWVFSGLGNYTGDTNSLPVIAAPPPPATATPVPPTATPKPAITNTPAPAPGGSQSRGIRGDYFRVRSSSAPVNGDLWFEFSATNTTMTAQYVGGLGAIIPGVWSQPSWGDFSWTPPYSESVLEWEDHINVPKAGTFTIYLGICWLSSRSACEADLSGWDLISPGVTITIY